jgi:hypothetical protein
MGEDGTQFPIRRVRIAFLPICHFGAQVPVPESQILAKGGVPGSKSPNRPGGRVIGLLGWHAVARGEIRSRQLEHIGLVSTGPR